MDFSASHLSLCAISTVDATTSYRNARGTDDDNGNDEAASSSGLSCADKLRAFLGKQLSPAKAWLLVVENLLQAVLAIIYLAVEGGSVLVAILNIAIPCAQVLASVCFFPRIQRGLGRWYARRFDAAVDDGDQLVAARMRREIEARFMLHMAPHSKYLRPIIEARAKSVKSSADDKIVVGDEDEVYEDVCSLCYPCLTTARSGELLWSYKGLGGQPDVLKAGLAFANAATWVQRVQLYSNNLTSNDARVVAEALRGNKHFWELDLFNNSIEDAGAEALAAVLPSCELTMLWIHDNPLSEGAHLNLLRVCRERGIDVRSSFTEQTSPRVETE